MKHTIRGDRVRSAERSGAATWPVVRGLASLELVLRSLATGGAILILAAAPAAAQGTLGSQALGYPPGQLSTRAEGAAGALADIDARTPANPAALVLRPLTQLYAQYDPELRSVTGSSGSASTTTARFPNLGVIIPANRRLVFGAGASTLLDRTWATETRTVTTFGADTVPSTESLRSEGGITDLRVGAGYAVNSRIRVGVALHDFTGSTRVTSQDVFADTLRFRGITQTSNLSYAGTAISGGFIVDILPVLSVSASGQKGGPARMYAGDTVLTHARIPDRFAGTISYQGLPGTLIAVRAERQLWSRIGALSTRGATAVDATDYSAGLESAGPRVGGLPILLRAGARHRTLPFLAAGNVVTENSFGAGLGLPVALDRVTLDLAVLRNSRSGVPGVSEHAYNFSFGLQVQP